MQQLLSSEHYIDLQYMIVLSLQMFAHKLPERFIFFSFVSVFSAHKPFDIWQNNGKKTTKHIVQFFISSHHVCQHWNFPYWLSSLKYISNNSEVCKAVNSTEYVQGTSAMLKKLKTNFRFRS